MNQVALVCLSSLLSVAAAHAAGMSAADRATPPARALIVAKADSAHTATLAGHRPAWALATNRIGAVPDSLPLARLFVELRRSAERELAFQALLRAQQDPASPRFHQWLTAEQIGVEYGPAVADIDAIAAWLRVQGFANVQATHARTRIEFDATAADVRRAFGTALGYYRVGDERRIAAADEPRVPAAFVPAIRALHGLASTPFRPQHASRVRSVVAPADGTRPNYTNCSGGDCSHILFPSDFATIYDINPLYAKQIDGSGQTIAIVGKARVAAADLTNFMQLAGVTFAQPTVIVPPAGVDPGPAATSCSTTGTTNTCDNPSDTVQNQSEATLDVTRAGSVAPGATIDLVVSADTGTRDGTDIATQYIVDTTPTPAKIISVSFGSCEAQVNAFTANALDGLYQQAAAEGISVIVSSDDSGVAGCATPFKTPPATQSAGINVLCASGSVTCVGGTEFADTANPSQYWSTTNGTNFESALGYIPEGAWNDPFDANGQPKIASSGGGVSLFIAIPSWQKGPGVPGTQGRYVPDVALPASITEGYFNCLAAEGAGCARDSNHSASIEIGGGTSASAPSFAGMVALLNQAQHGAQGNLNPRLYALGASGAGAVFHDVTVASSGVAACTPASPSLCNNSTPGPNGLSGGLGGFVVGTGYDLVTGWGSVDAANLVSQWNPSTAGITLGGYLSGNWYDASQAGHGFQLEFTSQANTMIAIWFVYPPNGGGQTWIYAQGTFDPGKNTVTLPAQLLTGPKFPPLYNSADLHSTPWGTLTFTFSGCNTGSVDWTSTVTGYGSGTLPLTRLTSIGGLSCPQ